MICSTISLAVTVLVFTTNINMIYGPVISCPQTTGSCNICSFEPCDQICTNLDGISYQCSCYPGFTLADNKRTCFRHVNECAISNGGCDQICTNTDASYYCSCTECYSLHSDKHRCEVRDCGSLFPPSYGYVQTPSGTTCQKTANYNCIVGYKLMGPSSRTCLSTGAWSNLAPICSVIDCGSLFPPSYGYVETPDGTTYGKTAKYNCSVGYTLIGPSNRTCLSTEVWSNSAPTCSAIICPPLPNPDNGTVRIPGGRRYGEIANYTCYTGYSLTGASIRTCQSTGIWSKSAPTCPIVDCGLPSKPENGQVYAPGGTTFGQASNYTCDAGYTLNGPAAGICQANGKWSNAAPTCKPVDCGDLTDPGNGTVATPEGTTFGKTATYSCQNGYVLSSQVTRSCLSNETWSGSMPSCKARGVGGSNESGDGGSGVIDCESLSAPANGHVETPNGTTYAKTANYNCSLGYRLIGPSSRTCLSTGVWSNSTPTCSENGVGGSDALDGRGSNETNFNIKTIAIGCSAAALLLIIIIAVIAYVCSKRRKRKPSQPEANTTAPSTTIVNKVYNNVSNNTNPANTLSPSDQKNTLPDGAAEEKQPKDYAYDDVAQEKQHYTYLELA